MLPLTEREIRGSFVNLTQGATKRMNVPRDLADRTWKDLDYLGWRDPQAPARGYLVVTHRERVVGIALRASDGAAGRPRKNMCSLCMTVHAGGGVALLVAPRTGRAGQQGHSVGTYICADLQCSLYLRHKLATGTPKMHETLDQDARVARLLANLDAFVGRVLG